MSKTTTKKIATGVAIVVFSGLILAGFRTCAWMRNTIIRLEERVKK
jgi:hypothetical protein